MDMILPLTLGTYTRGEIKEPLARLSNHVYPICRGDQLRMESCAICEQTFVCITLKRLGINVIIGSSRHAGVKLAVVNESEYPLNGALLFITNLPRRRCHPFPPTHLSPAMLGRWRANAEVWFPSKIRR
jgi:hypothetical protein